jgi:peptidoglycan/xylan/chitin deacetylase (PgdA/CDA1 family)
MAERRRSILLPAIALIAAALLPLAAPAVASAATLTVRLEAGPQAGVTFDTAWHVTSRRTVTLSLPVTVTSSSRVALRSAGTWMRMTSGPLAGRWVRQSLVAYVPSLVDVAQFTPARGVTLRAGTWELYRFDTTGAMTDARAQVVAATTVVQVDRAATIRGQRHLRVAGGGLAGWWVPGTTAAPLPVTCAVGSPPNSNVPVTVRAAGASTGRMALTFDMGGRLVPALSIVRFLELQRICTTIFPTGDAASTATGRAVLAEVAAHPELFELGNHTQHHCDLVNGGGAVASCPAAPTTAFVQQELRDADAVIAAISGHHTTPYWRPPYGSADATVKRAAFNAGWPYTVMWAVDTIDWKPIADGGPTAAAIAAKVVAGRTAGGVVLMHLGGYETRRALPAMILGLRNTGYGQTSVSGLYR